MDRHATVKVAVSATLKDHPDRTRWNEKYSRVTAPTGFTPSKWLDDLLDLAPPAGPVLELACGPSGTALALAARGRSVTAIDVSDKALGQLGEEAQLRGVLEQLTLVHADLEEWRPAGTAYALVICRLFWSAAVFRQACEAVAAHGLLAWEAPVRSASHHSHVRSQWRLGPGEPANLLPADFDLLREAETSHDDELSRLMVARRR